MTETKKATAATFALVPKDQGKFSIKSLDDGTTVHALFNPKELSIDRDVPWGAPGDAGGGNGNTKPGDGGIEMQFTGAKGRTFSVELLFDWERLEGGKKELMKTVADLEHLATVINPKSKTEKERRPHWCVAVWGSALKGGGDNSGFRCVITKLGTKYEMFDAQGSPLRVRCTLALSEASSVSIKDKNPKPKPKPPAGAPAPGGAPASGSAPAAGGTAPASGGSAPASGGSAPASGGSAPAAGGSAPASGGSAPAGSPPPRPPSGGGPGPR